MTEPLPSHCVTGRDSSGRLNHKQDARQDKGSNDTPFVAEPYSAVHTKQAPTFRTRSYSHVLGTRPLVARIPPTSPHNSFSWPKENCSFPPLYRFLMWWRHTIMPFDGRLEAVLGCTLPSVTL